MNDDTEPTLMDLKPLQVRTRKVRELIAEEHPEEAAFRRKQTAIDNWIHRSYDAMVSILCLVSLVWGLFLITDPASSPAQKQLGAVLVSSPASAILGYLLGSRRSPVTSS